MSQKQVRCAGCYSAPLQGDFTVSHLCWDPHLDSLSLPLTPLLNCKPLLSLDINPDREKQFPFFPGLLCQVLSAVIQPSLLPDSLIPFIFPHRLFLVSAPPVWSYPCCPGPFPGFLPPFEAVGFFKQDLSRLAMTSQGHYAQLLYIAL